MATNTSARGGRSTQTRLTAWREELETLPIDEGDVCDIYQLAVHGGASFGYLAREYDVDVETVRSIAGKEMP